MATSTVNTNKPIIPRGVDDRPVDKYNRAELYSGKALDFDGVNDWINLEGLTLNGSKQSFAFYLKSDAWGNYDYIFDINPERFIIASQPAGNLSFYDGTGWKSFGEINDTTNTNHFVVTVDGTTSKAYLNGVQFGSALTIASRDFSSATKCALMAQYDGNSGVGANYNGQLSGFKIFNTALTAAQVADLYNNPEKVVPTGVSDSALKLWLPMMEGAGTTAINGAPDALGSELITNGDFDTDSDWTKGTGTTISGGKANLSNATSVSLYQDIGTQSGKVQVSFNVSNYSSGTLNVYSGSNQNAAIINVEADANGFYSCYVERGGGNENIIFGSSDNFTGSIDDVSVKEISGYGTINGATWTHGIGAPVAQTAVIDWNKKYFENVANVLIPQGLTAGRDLLGNLFENVRKQGALNLDGNSWAEVHDNASLDFGTGSFTLEAWVRVNYLNQGSAFNVILGLGGNASDAGRSFIYYNGTFDIAAFAYNNNASASLAQTIGTWIHIAGTYDETNATLYINGAQVDQDARTAADITNDLVKMIGRDSTTARYYNDQIAQPRIYNRALTASEVLNNYNATSSLYI